MLEGLEITEINLKDLKNENLTFRIDSEFLKKEYLKNIESLKKYKYGFFKLQNAIQHMTGGATPLGAEYSENGIPFLRVQNIMQNYFSLNEVVYITKSQNDEIKRSSLKYRDVLLTITGVSYGKSATVTKKIEGSNINQHSVKITLNDKLNPFFLSTFFNSSFGKLQSDKSIVGVTRPALDYEVIKNFTIPIFPITLQEKIELLIAKSEEIVIQSQNIYKEAETLLLETLSLKDFEPSTDGVNVKSYKESFLTSGRLDSEFYQKKYEDIESKILGYRNGADILKNQIEYITTGEYASSYESVGMESVPYIRNNNMKKGHIELDDEYNVNPNNFKTKANIGEILTSRVGTIGLFGVIKAGQENCVYSDNILCFKLTGNYIPEVYAMLFSTELYKLLLEKLAGGSVQPLITQTSLKELPIPNVEYSIQLKVADLINESFRLKKQSEQLLETAKRAVEIAIEQDEDAAMRYINNQSLLKN